MWVKVTEIVRDIESSIVKDDLSVTKYMKCCNSDQIGDFGNMQEIFARVLKFRVPTFLIDGEKEILGHLLVVCRQ